MERLRYLFLVIVFFISACSYGGGGVSGDVLKIGFISPQTGTAALYGVPALRAAEYAASVLNEQGGILGKKVKLVVEDGQCDGKTAASAAQKLIHTDKVSILMAGHCSTESMVVAPIASKNKVLMLAQLTSTPDFPNIPYVYRTSPSSSYYMGKTAEVAYERGYRKVAVLVEQRDFPQGVAKDFAKRFKELGGEILAREDFAPGNSDFRTEITKLRSLNPDSFLIEAQGPDSASLILQQLKELGVDTPLIGGPIMISEGTFKESAGLLPKEGFTVTVHTDPEDPKVKPFVQYMDEKYGGIGFTLFYIAGVYDNLFLLKEAAESCGSTNSDCLDKYMKNLESFEGISGVVRFDDKKNPLVPLAIKTIKDGKEILEPLE